MRILEIAPYIYKKGYKNYERNKTGFGIVVKDIVWGLSNNNQVILATNSPPKNKKIDNIDILKFNMLQIIFKLFTFRSISKIIQVKRKYNMFSIKVLFYCALSSYYIDYININMHKIDKIHLHGICLINEILLRYLQQVDIPVCLTLHGLIKDSSEAPEYLKKMENFILSECEKNCFPVTVVSTGMQRKIRNCYNNLNCIVINNGTDIPKILDYNKEKDYYQLITIGNIGVLKNQIQIIDSLQYIDSNILKKIKLKIIGGYSDTDEIEKKIKELKLENNVEILGFLDKKQVNNIIKTTNLNILASIEEGFGMSIIESLSYGVPSVFFNNIDISEDIDNKMCLKVKNRNSKDLANAIEFGLKKEWNKNSLYKYSTKFSKKTMIENYNNLLLSLN